MQINSKLQEEENLLEYLTVVKDLVYCVHTVEAIFQLSLFGSKVKMD
jgi:hypothetical protein